MVMCLLCVCACVWLSNVGQTGLGRAKEPSKVRPSHGTALSHFPLLADFGQTTVIDVIKLEIYAMAHAWLCWAYVL